MRKAITHLKASDPVLAAIIARVGPYRMTYREPAFATLVRSIVFQQLNGKAASKIAERLVQAAGGELTPEALTRMTDAQFRAAGISPQKLRYLRDLAQRTASGEIDFAKLPGLSDAEVIEHLTRVKGVGIWTAQMFLMFALRRANIMPTNDLGVLMAIRKHYRKRKLPKPQHVLKLAKNWAPYCSVACWYLWRSMDVKL
ncbi:MAG: DNA-3-methyladenine glycosylase [Acidobacteriales bacterium]|nr:DNA-3-methyladenine glycosylase [Terriglobales bacterium]